MLADALHQFVENGILDSVVHGDESMVAAYETHGAARFPRSEMSRHEYHVAVAHLAQDVVGVVETYAAAQLLVADARLAYDVDYLFRQIAVIEGADAFELLFGLVGERIAQIGHYHAAAVA